MRRFGLKLTQEVKVQRKFCFAFRTLKQLKKFAFVEDAR